MVMIKGNRGASQLSGKFAGNVFSISNGTQYMRAGRRIIRTEPSSNQKIRRSAWNYLQQQVWKKLLTAEHKSEWQTYADNHPKINRIGDSITLTGFSAFMSVNINRRSAGLPVLLQPIDLTYL